MFLKGKGEQLNHMAVFNDVWNTTGDKNRNRKECCLPNSASLFCFIIQIFVFYLNWQGTTFFFLSSFELVWIFRRESETSGEKHVFLVCQFRKCFLFFFVRRDSVRQMKGKGNCFDPQTHRQVKVPSLLIACFPIFFFSSFFIFFF